MTTAPLSTETTPLVHDEHSSNKPSSFMKKNPWLLSVFCGFVGVAVGMILMIPHHRHYYDASNNIPSTQSKYNKVQGLGFQIYTGAAPGFLSNNTQNPECLTHKSYGKSIDEEQIQCYIGHADALEDAKTRVSIMKQAVERAYKLSDTSEETLKVFIAPEFYFRGVQGSYHFADDKEDEDCGPICVLLQGLEEIVANCNYKDWLFVFGTVICSEALPAEDAFDYLFYNFAPVYKGYDPSITDFTGKRFLVPKRYVSSSDFLTPQRHVNQTLTMELLDKEVVQQDVTIFNPFDFQQKRYDNDMWVHYKEELRELGYTMIEYGWILVDGLSVTIEICFDHDRRTALNSYLADVITGSTTLIPSLTDDGLAYVNIPTYQAQISVVSSAGMVVIEDSIALTDNGTIFLQDGLDDETGGMSVSMEDCNKGEVEFEGGTESIQRKAVLTPTDVFFEYKVRRDFEQHSVFQDWKEALKGCFTTAKYEPLITVYEPIDIAKVTA